MLASSSTPFFSVVTPSWNQGDFFAACVESVLAQNDAGFEHIVFDNCSDDATRQVAARYPHLRFFSESDRGQSHAVNKGFALARGEVVCWLNADDEYAPGAFQALRHAFSEPATMVVFGDALQVGYAAAGEITAPGRFEHRDDLVRWWSGEVKLHQPSVFFRASVLEEVGPLREDLHYAMDYEFWWRLSENFSFRYLPRVFARQHRQSQSKTILAWHKVLEEREKVFAPYYSRIDNGNRAALMEEKSRALAKAYLSQAYSVVETRKREAVRLLCCALIERPSLLFEGGWAGVIKRAVS